MFQKFITEFGEDAAEGLAAFLESFVDHWPNREPAALLASNAFHFKLAETKLLNKILAFAEELAVHQAGLGGNHAHSFPNNGSNWGEGVVMQHLVQGATEDQMSSTAPVIVQKWERMQKKNAKRDDKHGKI